MTKALPHGGRIDAARTRYGGAAADWLDLSTGINPDAYPDIAVPADAWRRLPDEAALAALIETARAYYRVPAGAAIIAAPGTQALLQILPAVLAAKSAAILSPTYNEHANCWRAAGCETTEIGRLTDLRAMADALAVVNPNNPTGSMHAPNDLAALAGRLAARRGLLIVDEAFCDCTPDASMVPELPENAIVLRSFGKFFGLAGLRLGFAIARPDCAARLATALGPWAVSGPALVIGRRALGDIGWIRSMREALIKRSARLAALLGESGWTITGQTPLFVFARHEAAGALHEALARKHILTRRFEAIPDHLRFGLPPASAWPRLAAALTVVHREIVTADV